jgi:hypothetical protein
MPVDGNATLGYVKGTGTFTAVGAGAAVPIARRGDFNLSLQGTFTATVALQRSFDGTTWETLTYSDGSALSWTAPFSSTWSEPEAGVQYRFNCTAYTSGSLAWRISQ